DDVLLRSCLAGETNALLKQWTELLELRLCRSLQVKRLIRCYIDFAHQAASHSAATGCYTDTSAPRCIQQRCTWANGHLFVVGKKCDTNLRGHFSPPFFLIPLAY